MKVKHVNVAIYDEIRYREYFPAGYSPVTVDPPMANPIPIMQNKILKKYVTMI
jgi:hypothetical protein